MKKYILMMVLAFTTRSAQAEYMHGEMSAMFGTTGGIATLVTAGGLFMAAEPIGAGTSLVVGVVALVSAVQVDNKAFDQEHVALAQEDMKEYLMGGEMSPAVKEIVETLQAEAEEKGMTQVSRASSVEIVQVLYSM